MRLLGGEISSSAPPSRTPELGRGSSPSLAGFLPENLPLLSINNDQSDLPQDRPARFVKREKKNWPVWICPVFACHFSTQYKKTIIRHLQAHGFPYEEIGKKLDRFSEANRQGDRWVDNKDWKREPIEIVIHDSDLFGGSP